MDHEQEGDDDPLPAGDEPPRKKPRGKSKAKREADKQKLYSTVKMKLRSALHDDDAAFRDPFQEALNDFVYKWGKIQLEAYIFANIHYLRLKSEEKAIPSLDHPLLTKCCAAVTNTTRAPNDPEIAATKERYILLRPAIGPGYTTPPNEYMGGAINLLAKEMLTASKNHVVVNFLRRLARYVRLKYALQNNRQAYDFINVAISPVLAKTQDQEELAEWIGELDPTDEDVIAANLPHFLLKLMDILSFMESLPAGTRHAKTFTILPTKGDFILGHATISRSTLRDILQMLPLASRANIMETLLPSFPDEQSLQHRLLLGALHKPRANFSPEMFRDAPLTDAVWFLLFDVQRHQTATRKFNFEISTNGYEISLQFQKPKPPNARPEDREPDFDPFPQNRVFDRVLGLDPGKTYLATTFGGELVHGQSRTVQVSTREYYHLAKMNRRVKWEKGIRESSPEYTQVISNMPSLKTQDLAAFEAGTRYVLLHCDYLLGFGRDKPFRKWRFTIFIESTKALTEIAKRIVGPRTLANGQPARVLVGYGDWSQPDGFKGLRKAPNKRFRKELRKHATVVSVDEHRTSKVCSGCQSSTAMRPARFELIKPCRKNARCNPNVIDALCRKCKFNAENAGTKFPSHQVLHCTNGACAVTWQRDVNASRNLYDLVQAMLAGQARPHAFTRGVAH